MSDIEKGTLTVNPLSWTTDGAFVPADKNLGAAFFDEAGIPTTTYPHFNVMPITSMLDRASLVENP